MAIVFEARLFRACLVVEVLIASTEKMKKYQMTKRGIISRENEVDKRLTSKSPPLYENSFLIKPLWAWWNGCNYLGNNTW